MFRFALALLAAPWTVLALCVRLVVAAVRLPGQLAAKNNDVIHCPAGHPNDLQGRWTCGCGAAYLGHAFGSCPVCSMPAGWMRCERCGLAILSPWKNG